VLVSREDRSEKETKDCVSWARILGLTSRMVDIYSVYAVEYCRLSPNQNYTVMMILILSRDSSRTFVHWRSQSGLSHVTTYDTSGADSSSVSSRGFAGAVDVISTVRLPLILASASRMDLSPVSSAKYIDMSSSERPFVSAM
jgi:hypothetical protein